MTTSTATAPPTPKKSRNSRSALRPQTRKGAVTSAGTSAIASARVRKASTAVAKTSTVRTGVGRSSQRTVAREASTSAG